MYYASKFCFGIRVVLLGSTILLSCNNPHATRMDEQANLDLGADVHQRDHNRVTALHMAAWSGDAGIVETLLSQIPEVDRVAFIHQRNNDGDSALHKAVRGDYETLVHRLLDRGADVNQRNINKETALHMAVRRVGSLALINTLLDRGADINQRNNNEETALHMAVRRVVILALINILLDLGDYINLLINY